MIYLFPEVNECGTARICKIFRVILKVCVKYNLSSGCVYYQELAIAQVLPLAWVDLRSEIFVKAIAPTSQYLYWLTILICIKFPGTTLDIMQDITMWIIYGKSYIPHILDFNEPRRITQFAFLVYIKLLFPERSPLNLREESVVVVFD